MTEHVPGGIKFLGVLYYLSAAMLLLLAILLFVGASLVGSLIANIPFLAQIGSALFIIIGIIFLALGVLSFFVGRGLWHAKQWARIIAIIYSVLGVVLSVLMMIKGQVASNVGGLLINLLIFSYLVFNGRVKQAFSSSGTQQQSLPPSP